MTFDRTHYLKVRAQSLRAGLSARLDEYALDFPGGEPKRAIELTKALVNAISHEIDSATDERALVLICAVIRGMGTLLEYFDNAHTAQTPRGLPEMLSSLIVSLDPTATMVAWPQSKYNYTIRDLLAPLKKMTSALLPKDTHATIFASFSGPLNFVSFPRIERDNVLLHAVFGHELGHPIADEFLTAERVTPKYSDALNRITTELMTRHGLGSDPTGALIGSPAQVKAYVDDIQGVLLLRKRGLQELISDSVAVLLFGPSALFASYDTLSLGDLDEPPGPGRYPPRRLRLRLTKQLLDSAGYTAALRAALTASDQGISAAIDRYLLHIDRLASRLTDRSRLGLDPTVKLAYDWIDATLPDAFEFSKTRVGAVTFHADRIASEVPELIERLQLQLPPSEVGVPPDGPEIDWRSALIAGWACRLRLAEHPQPGSPEAMKQRDTVNRLTLRGVEYIILANQYRTFAAAGGTP